MNLADAIHANAAVDLAAESAGMTRPNPPVGAVIAVGAKELGRGRHLKAGGDHAEIAAIKDAISKGVSSFREATLYVSLEPCSTKGRTGACTDAIIKAGFGRVVYACPDPNPAHTGKAKAMLEAAGIECVELPPDDNARKKAEYLVKPFAKHQRTGLPYLTVKIAMSLDGRICDLDGGSKWITSEDSRLACSKTLRERVDAIMVGAETVRRDNPSLLPYGKDASNIVRAVVSRSGNLPRDAKIFTDGKAETLVFGDAAEAMRELGRMGCLHVLCEGGLSLARSLAEGGFVDRWLTVLAPKVIGSRPVGEAVCGRFVNPDVPGDAFIEAGFGELEPPCSLA